MLAYLPDLDPQGNRMPTFNKADWDWTTGYVSFADLLEYAQVNATNYFTQTQGFTSLLFAGSINGVSDDTFSHLEGVSAPIQDQFDDLTDRTTGISYNSVSGRTAFQTGLSAPTIVLNNKNLESRLITIEGQVSGVQTKTTGLAYNADSNTTSVSGTLSVGSVLLQGTDLGARIADTESETAALRTDVDALAADVLALESAYDGMAVKANDADVVHLAGAETITGAKDFVGGLTLNGVAAASEAFVSSQIAALVDNAPDLLNTLGEIALALQAEESATVSILSSITSLSSDVSSQFAGVAARFINWNYDAATNTQLISGSGTAVSERLATNALVSNELQTGALSCASVFTNELVCSSIRVSSTPLWPVIYLHNSGLVYPLLQSGTVADLNGLDAAEPVYLTMAPGWRIVFLNADRCTLAEARNPTAAYLYNLGLQFTDPPVSFLVLRV